MKLACYAWLPVYWSAFHGRKPLDVCSTRAAAKPVESRHESEQHKVFAAPLSRSALNSLDALQIIVYLLIMKFVPSRQLSARPGKVWEDLKREGAIVITKDGIPFGIMVPTSDATMVDDVEELVFSRARKAVRAIRSEAYKKGLDRLTVQEIDTEIRKSRTRR